MSDITLTIDADTARYIAKIAKLAEASGDLKKPIQETNELWEAGVEVLGNKLMKLSLVGAAIGVVKLGADSVTQIYDNWIERLERAKKTLEDIARGGKESLGGRVEGPGAARGALMGLDNQLSNDQRFAANSAYRAAHPGASTAQSVAAVSAAADAEMAGFNPTQFAGSLGKLRMFGNDAKDVAAMSLGQGGEQGGAIVELLADIATKLGVEQARATLPLAMSAAKVNGGLDVLREGYGAFVGQGRQGSFADTFSSMGRSLVPGMATAGVLGQVNAGMVPINTSGYFNAVAGAGENDPINAADATLRAYENRKTNRNFVNNAPDALRRAADQGFHDYYSSRAPIAPRFSLSVMRKIGFYNNGGVSGDQEFQEGVADAAQTANALDAMAARLEAALEKQTADQRAPAVGTSGEGGP